MLFRSRLKELAAKLQDTKQKIVATKEGGAITGEERIREHLDLLYGAVNGWEGRPARYLLDRIDVLRRELSEVEKAFDALATGEIRALESALREKKLEPIPTTAQNGSANDFGAEAIASAQRCLARRACTLPDEVRATVQQD